MTTFLINNQPLKLGKRFDGGGEADIYRLQHYPFKQASELCVKIYKSQPSKKQIEKLQAMVKLKVSRSSIAWPQELVFNKSGSIIGFVMPLLKGNFHKSYEIHQDNTRKQLVNWPKHFHYKLAADIAKELSLLHQNGIIVGDFNHANIMINVPSGAVAFVDMDSVQIQHLNKTHYCNVQMPEYLPPELSNVSLSNTLRNVNSDVFCFAILCFYLLAGFHPFSGKEANNTPVQPSDLNDRLKNELYCYRNDCQPPLLINSKTASFLSTDLQQLFMSTFCAAANGYNRPSLSSWANALDASFNNAETKYRQRLNQTSKFCSNKTSSTYNKPPHSGKTNQNPHKSNASGNSKKKNNKTNSPPRQPKINPGFHHVSSSPHFQQKHTKNTGASKQNIHNQKHKTNNNISQSKLTASVIICSLFLVLFWKYNLHQVSPSDWQNEAEELITNLTSINSRLPSYPWLSEDSDSQEWMTTITNSQNGNDLSATQPLLGLDEELPNHLDNSKLGEKLYLEIYGEKLQLEKEQ